MLNSFYEIKNVKSRCSGKIIYGIVFLMMLTIGNWQVAFSQTAPAIEWQKCFGGSMDEEAISIQQTLDEGYIAAGWTNSTNGDISGNHGNQDFWIVKLDSSGNLLWQKCFGGTNNDIAYSIQQTTDGGYIAAGSSNSYDGDVSGNHGMDDYWIIKLDSAGNLLWQKSLGGGNNDIAKSILQTNDGGYIVAGYSQSNDGNVSGNHDTIPPLMSDYWIVKLDTAGNIQWQKCYGGTWEDQANCIKQSDDGGYLITGFTGSNDGDVTGFQGDGDFWTIKIDSIGNLHWQKCLGGTSPEISNSMLQTTDGGSIAVGESGSNDGDVTSNNGFYDFWITKLDTNGNLQWQNCFGGTDWEDAYSIQQTSDFGFVIGGVSNSNDGNISGNHGYDDFWIVKTDSNINLQWEKSLGGTLHDWSYSSQQTSDSGYIIAGYTMSNDGDVSGNHGNHDYWIVKLAPDTITGISNLQSSTFNLQFSPNPLITQSTLTFSNHQKNTFHFTLYDITGRVVESVSTANDKIILEKENKLAGVYLFNLTNEKIGERMNGKIVISN